MAEVLNFFTKCYFLSETISNAVFTPCLRDMTHALF